MQYFLFYKIIWVYYHLKKQVYTINHLKIKYRIGKQNYKVFQILFNYFYLSKDNGFTYRLFLHHKANNKLIGNLLEIYPSFKQRIISCALICKEYSIIGMLYMHY